MFKMWSHLAEKWFTVINRGPNSRDVAGMTNTGFGKTRDYGKTRNYAEFHDFSTFIKTVRIILIWEPLSAKLTELINKIT